MAPLTPTHRDARAADRWRRLGAWRDEPLGDTLARTVVARGGHVAVVDGPHRLTFERLDDVTRRLATVLVERGVGQGDVVAFQLPSWWESVALTIASWRIGAVANPVLPNLRAHELSGITREGRPRVLVVPERFRGFDHVELARSVDHGAQLLVVRPTVDRPDSLEAALAGAAPADDRLLASRRPDPDAPALLLYTSGTTAGPKGVLHTHNTLRAEADGVEQVHECVVDDVILVTMPLAHVGGVLYGILLPVTMGLRAVLVDIWDAEAAVRLTEQEGVTVHPGVPLFLRGMLAADCYRPEAVATMRLFAMGGARVTAGDVDAAAGTLGCWCKRSYGSTEMPTVTSGPRHDVHGRLATTDGLAIGPTEIRIVDERGVDRPPGTTGEIWCRGPELFVGYVDAALNADAFAPGGWYRSGDLGVLDADGFLSVVGRTKDLIIRGGENISPQEVETILLGQPEVVEVAVVAMPDVVMGERACAFVVARDAAFDFATMVDRIRAHGVAAYKIPERLELRDDLPRTATGKIRKDLLRDEIAALVAGEREPG